MPSPFPGMDPYLESPRIWPDVHHELISQIRSELNPRLPSHYVARVELRVYRTDQDDPGIEVIIPDIRVEESEAVQSKKSKRPPKEAVAIAEPETFPILVDDEIKEARIEIRERECEALVTIIEILSPTNKISGSYGRESLLKKRRNALENHVNWVEMDLLRKGLPTVTPTLIRSSHYRVILYRAGDRRGRNWPIDLRQPLPIVAIPLRGKERDVPLDLQKILDSTYATAAYERSIIYAKDADPPLTGDDRTWASKLLRAAGLR